MSVTWNITPDEAWGALVETQVSGIEAGIVALAESLLDDVQSYMQREARWTDRTGEARASLYTDIDHAVRRSVHLLMSHGPNISYAQFLEYAHAGRYEILSTTTDHWWPILYRGVVEIVRRHRS